jgi:hypothetical protein
MVIENHFKVMKSLAAIPEIIRITDSGLITKYNSVSYLNDNDKLEGQKSKFPGHNDSILVSDSN